MMRVCITGAPMSGKSELIEKVKIDLRDLFSTQVYRIPEVASELISGGINPRQDANAFQSVLYRIQKEKENAFIENADPSSIILMDRGLLDGCCYVDKNTFDRIMEDNGDTESTIFDRYDLVVQLGTICRGISTQVENKSNPSRIETSVDEVIDLEDKLVRAYQKHPNYVFIPAETDITKKYILLLSTIKTHYKGAN